MKFSIKSKKWNIIISSFCKCQSHATLLLFSCLYIYTNIYMHEVQVLYNYIYCNISYNWLEILFRLCPLLVVALLILGEIFLSLLCYFWLESLSNAKSFSALDSLWSRKRLWWKVQRGFFWLSTKWILTYATSDVIRRQIRSSPPQSITDCCCNSKLPKTSSAHERCSKW